MLYSSDLLYMQSVCLILWISSYSNLRHIPPSMRFLSEYGVEAYTLAVWTAGCAINAPQ